MTTLNISLPETMRTFVNKQIKREGYSTVSEYIRQLIRNAQKESSEKQLESFLMEGLESGEATEMTKQDWKNVHQNFKKKLAKK